MVQAICIMFVCSGVGTNKYRLKESLYKFICDKVCINIKQSVQQNQQVL